MIKLRLVRAISLAVLTLMSSVSVAEILQLPGGGLGVTQSKSSPQRGSSEADVLAKFGEPEHRHRPVGSPAISSWEYSAFEVYFENGLVIHAVHRSR